MNFLFPDRWAALAAQYPERTMGRITLREKGGYRIRTSMGEQNALVSGKFRPGVKFCVSDIRQKSRMALESRADSGLNPLITESHGGQNGMRAGTA